MTGKKINSKVFFILFILTAGIIFSQGLVFAATPEFRLDIDSVNLQKGISSNLVLSMVNAQGAEVTDISGIEKFDVVSTSSSTMTQMIDGSKSEELDMNYVILPKSTGRFTLQGNVKYNGTTYQTNQLQINVAEANNSSGEAQDLYIKTILSDSEVYVGQKIVLAYELYSRYNIENYGFLDNTGIKDFISKDMPEDNLQSEIINVDGTKYARYEIKQSFITPIKSGTFTIPAYNFQANVSTGNFFNSSEAVYLQTEAKELKVKPLPTVNQPSNFSGVVGELKLDAGYSKNQVNYGDSLTLNVTASGDCNLDNLKEMIKGDIPGFSVYQTEKNSQEMIENGQYKASKEFQIILVPKTNGDIKIIPMTISYFNPVTGSYEQAEIPGTTISVVGEAPQIQTAVQGKDVSPTLETVRIDQVSYDSKGKGYLTIQMKKEYLYQGIAAISALLVLVAAIFWTLSYMRKRDGKLEEIYKQIKKAKDQNEIYSLFNHMIKQCLNLSLKACSKNMVKIRLADQTIVSPILEIMDYMEGGNFQDQKDHMFLKTRIQAVYNIIKTKR